MRALEGVGVLVTRPEQQANPLCRLLESEGATAARLPTLEIRPLEDQQQLKAILGPIEAFDLVVFTSANAVKFGVPLLDPQSEPVLAAIGPATARALIQAGFRVAITPADGYDSDNLLAHPKLQDVAGRRVLIVKGLHGREVLQEQLARRGALVLAAEVYERRRADPSTADLTALEKAFAAGLIHVITATSVDIAAGLLELAHPALRREFDRVHWLVPGTRVATALRELGVTAPLLQAHSAEDHDLVSTIKRWRSSASGA